MPNAAAVQPQRPPPPALRKPHTGPIGLLLHLSILLLSTGRQIGTTPNHELTTIPRHYLFNTHPHPHQFTHITAHPSHPNPLHAFHILVLATEKCAPLMRKHGWTIPVLMELPAESSLLGLTQRMPDSFQKRGWTAPYFIALKVRVRERPGEFKGEDEIADTLLHEMAHLVYREHCKGFMELWRQLRREYDGLYATGLGGLSVH